MSVSQPGLERVAGLVCVPVKVPSGSLAALIGLEGPNIRLADVLHGLQFQPGHRACLATISGPIIAAHRDDPLVSNTPWPASNPATALMTGTSAILSVEAFRPLMEGLGATEVRRVDGVDRHGLSMADPFDPALAATPETPAFFDCGLIDMCADEPTHVARTESLEQPVDGQTPPTSPEMPATFAIFADNPIVVIPHQPAMEVPYGTIAAWINPCSIDGIQTLIALDEQQSGDCGRFRLAMDSDRIHLHLASPYDGCSHDWVSEHPVFKSGVWTHIAATFDNQGVTVFADGVAVEDRSWCRIAGPVETPSAMVDFSLENNRHPMVMGCEACALQFLSARDESRDEPLQSDQTGCGADSFGQEFEVFPFTGLIAEYGLWGGYIPTDALNAMQVAILSNKRPAAAAADKAMDAALTSALRESNRRRDKTAPRSRNWGIVRKRPATTQDRKSAKVHSLA